MSKITIDVSDDQMDLWVRDELRRCYVDTVTVWKNQQDAPELGDALLTVIQHYSAASEYEEWYETIKDL